MNNWKNKALLLLAGALCLTLAACGGEEEEDNIAGNDWRTTGIVDANGTIVRDGSETPVLACIHTADAAFYYDQEEQVFYDGVEYPIEVADAAQADKSLSFDDLDGDGNSDVQLKFHRGDSPDTIFVWYWVPEEGYVFQPDQSYDYSLNGDNGDGEEEDVLSFYQGLWEYEGDNIWLRIQNDASWEFINSDEETIESGTALCDTNGVELHYDGSGDVLYLELSLNGDLLDRVNNGKLVKVEEIVPTVTTPFFEENGLAVNAELNGGSYLLEQGVCHFMALGEGYATGDCYWEVVPTSDALHGTVRQLEFDAVCYVPQESVPVYYDSFVSTVSCELYDYNTGAWLTTIDSGENQTYRQTIDWAGRSYEIEFSYTSTWDREVGDWFIVLTKHYTVYLPDGYDGLVLAAQAMPDNYRDNNKRAQLDSICPAADILHCDTITPYANLYFAICQ